MSTAPSRPFKLLLSAISISLAFDPGTDVACSAKADNTPALLGKAMIMWNQNKTQQALEYSA